MNLFATSGEPEEPGPKFVKAGPNGFALERVLVKDGKRVERGDDLAPAQGALEPLLRAEPERESGVRLGAVEVGREDEVSAEQEREGLHGPAGFIDLTEELAAIREETKLEAMAVIGFIRRERVERWRIQNSYYLGGGAPDGPLSPPRVIALLRAAMVHEERVAVVKWTKRTRQFLGIVTPGPRDSVVVLEMTWAAEVREPGPRMLTHKQEELSEDEVRAARELLRVMGAAAAIVDEAMDDRVRLERALEARALSGRARGFRPPVRQKAPAAENALELLRRSRG